MEAPGEAALHRHGQCAGCYASVSAPPRLCCCRVPSHPCQPTPIHPWCSKAPLSDNLEVVAPQALLEPEEALVARKLSTVYERRSMGAASSGGSGGGPRLLAPRPGSGRRGPGGGAPSLGRRSVEAAGSVSEQLMEEGVVDSAALEDTATAPGASRGHLPGVGEAEEDVEAAAAEAAAACQPAPAAAAAAAGAGEGGETAQTSLMHDIVHDWGVGMRDLNAVMRASVGVYQVWVCVCGSWCAAWPALQAARATVAPPPVATLYADASSKQRTNQPTHRTRRRPLPAPSGAQHPCTNPIDPTPFHLCFTGRG